MKDMIWTVVTCALGFVLLVREFEHSGQVVAPDGGAVGVVGSPASLDPGSPARGPDEHALGDAAAQDLHRGGTPPGATTSSSGYRELPSDVLLLLEQQLLAPVRSSGRPAQWLSRAAPRLSEPPVRDITFDYDAAASDARRFVGGVTVNLRRGHEVIIRKGQWQVDLPSRHLWIIDGGLTQPIEVWLGSLEPPA
ncbi:MAG: hypothetical protein AB7O52_18365 [Planctomycetota bacterium]